MLSGTLNFMHLALSLAENAKIREEVPVGAVLVDSNSGQIIAKTSNRVEELSDPTAHAEILAIRDGGTYFKNVRLSNCDLYVTLEPCAMCAQAISFARLRRLYFGAYDIKGGGVEHGAKIFQQATCKHIPEVYGGIEEKQSVQLLASFFRAKR